MKFQLNGQSVDSENEPPVVTMLREVFNSGHCPVRPCHSGQIKVSLSITGSMGELLFGNVRCDCGAPIGEISGSSDGSNVILKPIGPGSSAA